MAHPPVSFIFDLIKFWLLFKSVRIVLLPVPAVAAHFLDTEVSLPTEFCLCLCRVAIACCDVARTTRLDRIRNRNIVNLHESIDNIKH